MSQYHGKVCDKHPSFLGLRDSSRNCVGCRREQARAYAAKNREARALYTKQYRANNPETVKAYSKVYLPKWLAANKDKNREEGRVRMREWRLANVDKVKEKANSPEMLAYRSARRASNKLATPSWADSFVINEIYSLMKLRNKMTHIIWSVDHIVPLKSDKVCGLHCEHNLRLIPKSVNSSKGNRYWPDMGTPC